jgi:hypothetical protein
LSTALEAQARTAALPITIEAEGIGKYPRQIDAAVYFCVLEALQNTAKGAQASAAQVTLYRDGQYLVFTVTRRRQGLRPGHYPQGNRAARPSRPPGRHHRHHLHPRPRHPADRPGTHCRRLKAMPPSQISCSGSPHPGGIVAYAGQTIENPVTKERITFRDDRRGSGRRHGRLDAVNCI